MERRDSIKSMVALMVAPAIIKVEMLMPVKPIVTVKELIPLGGFGPPLPMSQYLLLQKIQDEFNIYIHQEIARGYEYLSSHDKPSGKPHYVLNGGIYGQT